ncbi:fatty acyl-CoA reductase wat [Drosophila grimshawi]|uniref:Fatty acyl-CoA reductase n=1 Tax=Drosophila grimshawi TaxID=7222 RepID=B4J498_DROGR|nr:fatty acyl-CoA reductase wat [Drosophila grimshawi]EDW00578.1 GH20933 [Drosophila grimshawi]
MESEIKNFYKNKNIFLTGASGFLGRMIVEKLLRSTEVNRIYVLLRPKRGKEIQERICEWKTDPVFALLLNSKPNAMERIVAIAGDCQFADLGISASDCELLKRHVELVIHSAATLSFENPLHLALDINTRATRYMVQLAKEMPHLVAFVYVSTAVSNCVIQHITERFYPEHLNCSADKVLALREMLDAKLFNSFAPGLVDKFPNTYTYTKALAEQVVQTEADDLPICIFRPGAIVATNKEPVSGWIDNIYGPIVIVYGIFLGILRIVRVNLKANCYIVPVDGCANLILASAWRTATERRQKFRVKSAPIIYNYVPSNENMMFNGDLKRFTEEKYDVYPSTKAIWHPIAHTTQIWWVYKLATIFYHLLPGYAIDLVLRMQGQKPKMIRIYDKIHKNMDMFKNFMIKSWSFETLNTDRLWASMSAADQQLFEFDVKSLDWSSYFDRLLYGIRIYLSKEEPTEESFERGRRKARRFLVLHRLLQFLLCCLAFFLVRWILNLFL